VKNPGEEVYDEGNRVIATIEEEILSLPDEKRTLR